MKRKISSYLFIFLCISFIVLAERSHSYSQSQSQSQTLILKPLKTINLPPNATGPQSIALISPNLNNPLSTDNQFYTSVSDGRILKYTNGNFIDFATTAPNRSKEVCDGNSDPSLEPICGRPLGLALNRQNGKLIIADPNLGLMEVDPAGGEAKQLTAAAADGVPFRSLNAVDTVQDYPTMASLLYFIDSSTQFQNSEISKAIRVRDRTGRLLRYNTLTRQTTVLLRNLGVPMGLAASSDGNYVLFSESIYNVTKRYWITGRKAGQSEVFVEHYFGSPNNIKRNSRGEFWVELNNETESYGQKLIDDGQRGRVLQTVIFDVENESSSSSSISEVNESPNGRLYVGSFHLDAVEVF